MTLENTNTNPGGEGGNGNVTPEQTQAQTPDWRAGFEQDMLDYSGVKGWKSPADVITSYRNAERLVGAPPERVLKLPDADRSTDAAAWAEIDARMGVPEAADKYENKLGESFDADAFTALSVEAHKMGVSASAFSAMQEVVAQHVAKAAEKAEGALTASTQEWITKNPADHAGVKALLGRVSATEEEAGALLSGLGAKGLSLLSRIAKGSQERQIIADTTPNALSGAEHAKAEISKLRSNPEFQKRFNSPIAGIREAAVAEINRLYRMKSGEI